MTNGPRVNCSIHCLNHVLFSKHFCLTTWKINEVHVSFELNIKWIFLSNSIFLFIFKDITFRMSQYVNSCQSYFNGNTKRKKKNSWHIDIKLDRLQGEQRNFKCKSALNGFKPYSYSIHSSRTKAKNCLKSGEKIIIADQAMVLNHIQFSRLIYAIRWTPMTMHILSKINALHYKEPHRN